MRTFSTKIQSRVNKSIVLFLFLLFPILIQPYLSIPAQGVLSLSHSWTDPSESAAIDNVIYEKKIDPRILDALEDPLRSSEAISCLLLFQHPNPDLSKLKSLTSHVQELSLLDGCIVRCSLKQVPNIASLDYIKSIWWDLPIKSEPIVDPSFTYPISPYHASLDPIFVNFTEEIHASDLWDMNITGKGVVIAVLDSGIDITGSGGGDLDDFDDNSTTSDPKFRGGVSMVPDEPLYYTDLLGRGTFHTGIACGTGGIDSQYTGVAPGSSYLNVKIFDSLGITYWSFMISGIEWAIDHGADILLFCATIPGLYVDPVCQIVNAAVDRGVFVVTPVGDDGPGYTSINTPGQANQALSVGAYDSHTNDVWTHSSRGPSFDFHVGPDILAPGVDLIGPRSRYLTSETLDLASGIISEISPEMKIVLQNQLTTLESDLSLLTENLPKSSYGNPLSEDSNYTQSSGTGAAAAVSAGAIALLLEKFPLAPPALIQQALQTTAYSISPIKDVNAQGAGLLNVLGAYGWLLNFFGNQQLEYQSAAVPLFYSGVVTNKDLANISQYSVNFNHSNLEPFDFSSLMSSQMMSTGLILSKLNSSDPFDVESINVHLPLNQFGIGYTLWDSSFPSPSLADLAMNREFHWFSEFNVVKEMHEMVNTIIYQDGYRRYASILEMDGLYITCIAETWSYSGTPLNESSTVNFTSPLTGEYYETNLDYETYELTHRINALEFSFGFSNYNPDQNIFYDMDLVSYFKADLFANETGTFEDLNYKSLAEEDYLDFCYDDQIQFDNEKQLIWVEDENNASSVDNLTKFSSMGFSSPSHKIARYAMGDSIDLLLNLTQDYTVNQTWNTTTSSFASFGRLNASTLHTDPGFATMYKLGTVEFLQRSTFTGILGLGMGSNLVNCRSNLDNNINWIYENTTKYNVTDAVVVSAQFSRIHEPNIPYSSTVKIINLGNVPIENTQLIFYSNRTLTGGEVEVFSRIFTIDKLNPLEMREVSTSWIPLEIGIYQLAWVIGNVDEFLANPSIVDYEYLLFQNPQNQDYREFSDSIDVNYLSNTLLRNVFIVDANLLENQKISHFYVAPTSLNLAPMTLFTPLDYGIYNLSILTFRSIDNVKIAVDGLGNQVLQFIDMDITQDIPISLVPSKVQKLDPYTSISVLLFGNPFLPPGKTQFNITFTLAGSVQPFYTIPVEFQLSATRGRVWFDATHLNFFQSDKITDLAPLTGFGNLDNFSTSIDDTFGSFGDITGGSPDLSSFIDLNERLDTTWGNFYDIRNLWSNPESNLGKSTLVNTVIPFLEIDLKAFFDFESLQNNSGDDSSSDYFFDTQSLLPDTSFLGDSIGNYKFENSVLSTTTINHDLLQFFDVLVLNDPEQSFTTGEIQDIVDWVSAGGTLFAWSEDGQHTNLESFNNLLKKFGLEFGTESFYPYEEYQNLPNQDGYCYINFSTSDRYSSLFSIPSTKVDSIALRDPVEVFAIDSRAKILGYKTLYDGEHGVIGLSSFGKGKVFALGDNDLFKEDGLVLAENGNFGQQIMQWALSDSFECEISVSSTTIPRHQQGFIDVSFQNYEELNAKRLFEDGFLFIGAFFDSKGQMVNASMYGLQTPLLPLFYTENGHYGLFFDSNWVSDLGTYYVMLLIDHPAAISEIFYLTFNIVEGPPAQNIVQYVVPEPAYPHYLDMVAVLGITVIILSLYYYNQEKYKTRLKITPLQGDYLNLAKTRLYEGETLFKLMIRGIDRNDVEDIERIRFLLSNQKRILKFFKDLKKFGDTIGEHY